MIRIYAGQLQEPAKPYEAKIMRQPKRKLKSSNWRETKRGGTHGNFNDSDYRNRSNRDCGIRNPGETSPQVVRV